ncbi:MAG: hypothetical protein JXA46_03755 [Dehalococcoidales bacterium]|nr:hypothetical protein [Dehalococcoidales bacterium]
MLFDEVRATDESKTTTNSVLKKSSYGKGCTQALMTGSTCLRGNMTGQCVDSEAGLWPGFLKFVTPEKGNRYLTVGGFGEEVFPLLNEKGVVCSQGLRMTRFDPLPAGQPGYTPAGEIMCNSNSASEFVKLWAENYTKFGSPWGGRCNLIIDTEMGYCAEGANFAYNDPTNHVIHGPMYDQVFVSANFYISKRLKALAEAGIGAGYNRAKRLSQLLVDRQYDSSMLPRSGGISLSYFMKCLRDHGNTKPEESRMGPYISEDRGELALCCHGLNDYTSNAFIGISRPDHTGLFSCEWITPSQPCISPFMPIYIGVNDIPAVLKTTEAYEYFEKLRFAVEYHPEYRDDVTKHWTVFEIHSIEESYLLERGLLPLIEQGKIEEVRERLTRFVQEKCDQAMTICGKMLTVFNDLPVIGRSAGLSFK